MSRPLPHWLLALFVGTLGAGRLGATDVRIVGDANWEVASQLIGNVYTITVEGFQNHSATPSRRLRLELLATAAPYQPGSPPSGWPVARSDGPFAPAYRSDLDVLFPNSASPGRTFSGLLGNPEVPTGTWYMTLLLLELSGEGEYGGWVVRDSRRMSSRLMRGNGGVVIAPPDDHGSTRDTATPLTPNSTVIGAILPATDVDYFRIDIPEPGRLVIQGDASPSALSRSLWLDATLQGPVRGTQNGTLTAGFRIDGTVSAAGPLFLKVHSTSFLSAGPYTLRAEFTPSPAPVIIEQPQSQTVAAGGRVTLSVKAAGENLRYQWRKRIPAGTIDLLNPFGSAVDIRGATNATYTITNVLASNAGDYEVVVSNGILDVISDRATLAVGAPSNAGRIVNLSIRTPAGNGSDALIVGFVVGGANSSGGKPLLIRAIGPGLAAFNVRDFLSDPVLDLYSGEIHRGSNNNWSGDSLVSTVAAQVGAFPLSDSSSTDAAMVFRALPRGAYTSRVTGIGAGNGIALAEIYDATPAGSFAVNSSRLTNISARAQVSASGGLVAGFVIAGQTNRTLLIRGVGPTLSTFGVEGALSDPKLEIYRGASLLQSNDDWGGSDALRAAFDQVGAFRLQASSKDAALLMSLQPGAYTAQIAGLNSSGVALIEVYEIP